MKGLNKVTLIGHAGDAPEVKLLSNQLKVAKLMLATNDSYKDEQGQLHTQTDWHTIIFWRSMADIAEKYIKKGSLLYIEGKLKTRSYEDEHGKKRYVTEVIAEELLLLDKKT